MKENIEKLKLIKDLDLIIPNLAKKFLLGILTSNSADNVNYLLKKYGLDKFFCCIISEFQIFGKHIALKRILKNLNLKKDEIIYIGDETRDIEAAKKIGITVIAVTWGFNSEKILKSFNPDYLIKTPTDLISILE